MLKKLLKYDLRTMWRFCAPMFIATGLVSVVCCALLYFTISLSDAEGVFAAVMMVNGFYAIGILAIVVMTVISGFMVFYRYYKSMFTDEGYLTMVIPVSTSTLLNAKLLSSLIFTAIITVVSAVSLCIAVIIPISLNDPSLVASLWKMLKSVIPALSYGSLEAWVVITVVIRYLLIFVEGVIIMIASITVGAILINKYKLLGAICMYLAVDLVHSILISITDFVFILFPDAYYAVAALVSNAIRIVLAAAFSALLYFLSLHTLKKKLNI